MTTLDQLQMQNWSVSADFSIESLSMNAISEDLDFFSKMENLEFDMNQKSSMLEGSVDRLKQYSDFINELKSLTEGMGAQGKSSAPAMPAASDSPAAGPPPAMPAASDSPAAGPAAPAGSVTSPTQPQFSGPSGDWSVDRESNTIKLGDNYQLKLNEATSEMLLEKLGDNGEVTGSTKVFQDPHIDVGNDGTIDADFTKDSTLVLEDGTKITMGTRHGEGAPGTFTDELTITNGDNAIVVNGLMHGADGLRISDPMQNGKELDAATNDGHLLFEKGNNSWELEDGRKIGTDTERFHFAQELKDQEYEIPGAAMGPASPAGPGGPTGPSDSAIPQSPAVPASPGVAQPVNFGTEKPDHTPTSILGTPEANDPGWMPASGSGIQELEDPGFAASTELEDFLQTEGLGGLGDAASMTKAQTTLQRMQQKMEQLMNIAQQELQELQETQKGFENLLQQLAH